MTVQRAQSVIIRTGTAFLVLLLAASGLFAQNADSKIDRDLLSALTAEPDATAPFFVILGERADLSAASRIPDRAARGRAVVQALQTTANASQAGARAYLSDQGAPFTPYWVQNTIFVPSGNLGLARALAQRPEVAAIIQEPVFSLQAKGGKKPPPPPPPTVEWNIAKIGADQVWPTTKGASVVVSNIDSGVRHTHNALVRQYRGNLGSAFDHNGNWNDPTGVCGPVPCDNTSHGTHVMGIMVGNDGDANQIGVAPEAKWIACKGCANDTACYGSDLMACAEWIMDPLQDGSGSNQPDVVNNSWGGGPGDPWFMSFVDSWRAAGIFPAFSAGNNGPGCSTAGSPGDYPSSFSSGYTDTSDAIGGYSSRGPSAFGGIKPDVSAPGVNVRSSIASADDSYGYSSGTSMASPHIAGTVALVWAAQPGMRGDVSGTEKLLRDTAVRLTTSENCADTAFQTPNNTYGYGRIDALAAATSGATPNQPPAVTVTYPSTGASFNCPATVSFSGTASDPEDGDLTSSLAWADDGTGFGTGGSPSRSYSCSEAGSHNVVATVTDAGGLTDADAITIEIVGLCHATAATCEVDSDCCSNKCTGKPGAKVCK